MRLATLFLLTVLPILAREPRIPPIKTTTFPAGQFEVTARFLDKGALKYEARLQEIAQKTLPLATELFGGLPRGLDGCEDPNVALDFDTTRGFHGEADPGWIEMGIEEGLFFGFNDMDNGLVHELFHLWNSEAIRYKHRREQWFSEGCTDYYGIKLAIRAGLIGKSEGVTRMLAPLANYLSAHGLGKRSIRAMCESQQLKMQHYFLVYHGGYVVSLVLDYDIRKTTKNQKSLDDLMRWLYQNFDRSKGQLYELEDFITGLQEITGKDYTDFFGRYVTGIETIPVGDFFQRMQVEEVSRRMGWKKLDPLQEEILQDMFELNPK